MGDLSNIFVSKLTIISFLFDNKYLGGYDGDDLHDEILEFDPLTGEWKLVDRMIQARNKHSVSVINFDSGLCI